MRDARYITVIHPLWTGEITEEDLKKPFDLLEDEDDEAPPLPFNQSSGENE